MKYVLLTTALIIGAFAWPVISEAQIAVDFESTPLFGEVNFIPGDVVSKTVRVTNNYSDARNVYTELVNVVNTDGLGDVINVSISGGTSYTGTFSAFDTAGKVPLGALASGASIIYTYAMTFVPVAGNEYQNKSLGFDLCIGLDGGHFECSGDVDEENGTGGGGGDGGGGGGDGGGTQGGSGSNGSPPSTQDGDGSNGSSSTITTETFGVGGGDGVVEGASTTTVGAGTGNGDTGGGFLGGPKGEAKGASNENPEAKKSFSQIASAISGLSPDFFGLFDSFGCWFILLLILLIIVLSWLVLDMIRGYREHLLPKVYRQRMILFFIGGIILALIYAVVFWIECLIIPLLIILFILLVWLALNHFAD